MMPASVDFSSSLYAFLSLKSSKGRSYCTPKLVNFCPLGVQYAGDCTSLVTVVQMLGGMQKTTYALVRL